MTEQQPMTLTDWRGNPYTVGTLIFYPRMSGRSCEIQEGEVLDIYEAVYDRRTYRGWMRYDAANPDHEGEERETRVKVQPTGRSSRDFYRTNHQVKRDEHGEIVRDENGRTVWEKAEAKPVTLTVIDNVTVADA
ncbi:hypothetical protein ACFLIM_39000 [Nonomuraea sp. M3C6]|uniref:Uncharacterized protein n=1 Tax=Nonomuraea marmarensis TaxID=3351344 RepID=A0ABW7AP55_9ACTN